MYITKHLIHCIKNNLPVTFLKYGDGEYNCITTNEYGNCDNDRYTDKLKNGLINAFKYYVNEKENVYIGLWHDKNKVLFWNQFTNKQINWCNYHSILFDNNDLITKNENYDNKIELFKTIKETKIKKIIVCNPLLIRSKILLDIDNIIIVPLRNWFDNELDNCVEIIKNIINTDERFIMITCCGMGAKVLIYEILKIFPNGIFLDFGSALDLICTKKDSRGFDFKYEELVEALKELLPADWEDEKYNEIFEIAKQHLGIHLHN